MDKITIEVFLANVHKVVNDLFTKHFIEHETLSEYEQNLLNDIQTLIVHSHYRNTIHEYFKPKKH